MYHKQTNCALSPLFYSLLVNMMLWLDKKVSEGAEPSTPGRLWASPLTWNRKSLQQMQARALKMFCCCCCFLVKVEHFYLKRQNVCLLSSTLSACFVRSAPCFSRDVWFLEKGEIQQVVLLLHLASWHWKLAPSTCTLMDFLSEKQNMACIRSYGG